MSFAIALGNSFENKDILKAMFKFQWNPTYKVWAKEVDKDAFPLVERHIEMECEGVRVYWASDISFANDVKVADRENFKAPTPDHKLDGAIIEVKKWYARTFHENHNTEMIFSNMEIIKVMRETEKAYLVDVKLFGGVAGSCGICGRRLDNLISQATGIGPICAEKIGFPRPTEDRIPEIKELLKAKTEKQGIISGTWIPKSQIKEIKIKGD